MEVIPNEPLKVLMVTRWLFQMDHRWMGSLYVKKWTHAVLVKCDVKPSQRSGTMYKTWVAVKPCGSVQCAIAHAWLV